MAVDYIPLATSPPSEESGEQKQTYLRRRPPTASALGTLARQFTKTRILLLLPLLALPILFHLTFSKLLRASSPSLLGANPYFHTGDVSAHNDEVIARIAQCESLGRLRNTSSPLIELDTDEEEALIAQGCGTNQTTVIILASRWFTEAYAGSEASGEVAYAQSLISTLNAYGYEYVFTGLGADDMSKTVDMWRRLRGNVRMVMADPGQVDACWRDEKQQCLKTPKNPDGLEAWRLMTFWYGDKSQNPLGEAFTLSPFPSTANTPLSMSIEPTCHRTPMLLSHERARPPQAYLLAEKVASFVSGQFPWSTSYLRHLRNLLAIDIVTQTQVENDTTSGELARAGIRNFGTTDEAAFYDLLRQSFVLVGSGETRDSARPWEALCLGVPFINPVLEWDEKNPDDRSKWHAQQSGMTKLYPPHVYHVRVHDLDGLMGAVKDALATPVGSFVPSYMRFGQVCEYTAAVINGDWRGKAQTILDARKKSGKGEMFEM